MAAYILTKKASDLLLQVSTSLASEHLTHQCLLQEISSTGVLPHSSIGTICEILKNREMYSLSFLDVMRNAKPCMPSFEDISKMVATIRKNEVSNTQHLDSNAYSGNASVDGDTNSDKNDKLEAVKKRKEFLIKRQEAREYNQVNTAFAKLVFG